MELISTNSESSTMVGTKIHRLRYILLRTTDTERIMVEGERFELS